MNEEIEQIKQLWSEIHPQDSSIEVTMLRRGQYAVDVYDENGELVEHHTTLKDWVTFQGTKRVLLRDAVAGSGE